MARRLYAVGGSDKQCKRKRAAFPVETCDEDAETYEITKKYAAESEDDSAESGNKKHQKRGVGERRRLCEAHDDECTQHYRRAPTRRRCKRKTHAQSSESASTTDTEVTVATSSSCESRQSGQLRSSGNQSSHENLSMPKTDCANNLKYKRIAGGAKKSMKRTKSRLETPTNNAQRMMNRENVRTQNVHTENADEDNNNSNNSNNNGTTKEMVRFMNKLLISLGNVENSFSSAVNSVSAYRQRAPQILNNGRNVHDADAAGNAMENYAHFGATNLQQQQQQQQQAHATQKISPSQKPAYAQESAYERRYEREFQYAPQYAATQSPLKTHAMPPTVHFNRQPSCSPETPNYLSTRSAQFNAYAPAPTATAPPTGAQQQQLPRLSDALPARQTLNALERNPPHVGTTNQGRVERVEYQPYPNVLPVFTNRDSKRGNEYAYLSSNPKLNQNPNIPKGSPYRPDNNPTKYEVESVAVQQNVALPGTVQTYYNSIDYNGEVLEPQLNGNGKQENSLNRDSLSERQSKANRASTANGEYTTNRGSGSEGGSGLSNGKDETNSKGVSELGTGISKGESKAKRGTITKRGNGISNGENNAEKANTKSTASEPVEANAEYSNDNEGNKRTQNERKSRVSKASALNEMFAGIKTANEMRRRTASTDRASTMRPLAETYAGSSAENEMRRRTTSNGKKYSLTREIELEESQSVEESSCSCKSSEYLRQCLRRKQTKKHKKYDDKQHTQNKRRKCHYENTYSDSESDEAYPSNTFCGERATKHYKCYADSASSDEVSYSLSRTSCRELKRCCSRIVAICRMARDTAATQTEQYWGDSATRLGKLNKMDDDVPKAILDGLATANPKVVEQILKMLRKRRKCKVCACGVVNESGAPIVKDDMIVLKFEEHAALQPPVMCLDDRSRSNCNCGTRLTETESEIIRDIVRKKRLLEKSQRINALTNSVKHTSCDGLSTCTCMNDQDEMEFVEGLLRRRRSERERVRETAPTGNVNSSDCDCTTRKAKELAAEILKELVLGHMQKMFAGKIENKTREEAERVSAKSTDTIISLSNEIFTAESRCACGQPGQETILARERAQEIRESMNEPRAGGCTCNVDESAMRMREGKSTMYRAGDDDGRPMVFQRKPLAGECTCNGNESSSLVRRGENIAPRAGECTCNGHESPSMARKSERITPQAGECTCVPAENPKVSRRSHRTTPRAGECTCYHDGSTTELAMSERIKAAVRECTSNSDNSITVIRISGRPKSTAFDCRCHVDGNPPLKHQGEARQRETVEASNVPRYSKLQEHSVGTKRTKRNTDRARETMKTEYQTILEKSLAQERPANAIPRSTIGENGRESELPTRRSDYPAQKTKNAYNSITEVPQQHRNGSFRESMRETKEWERKTNVSPESLESDKTGRASNRQSEYREEHIRTSKGSTMDDTSPGEDQNKNWERKSERASDVIERANERPSEHYQAQPRITASESERVRESMIIEPPRSSNLRSGEFVDTGEKKTAELEARRKYKARDSSYMDKEGKRRSVEAEESKPIEMSKMDTDQRNPTKYQLVTHSESDSGNAEEGEKALKKSMLNGIPRLTDYTSKRCRTDCGCRETNIETNGRTKNYNDRDVGNYEEEPLLPTRAEYYGAHKCRTDCGCKIISTALKTRSKEDEVKVVREYEERIMARANSTRMPRPANYAAKIYSPKCDCDVTNAFRERIEPPYEDAMAVDHNGGVQNVQPNLANEDDGMSLPRADHESLQKFVIDIKACKQATASCTLTAYPKTHKNAERETNRSIARAEAENTDSDLQMQQRAALCAELTMNELLPQHSLRTLLTKLSSPQGKLTVQHESLQKGQFNPTIFRAQMLQTTGNKFGTAADTTREILLADRRRELKLTLSAPSIITRSQYDTAQVVDSSEDAQSKLRKKSLIPLPVGSRRLATSSMLLMQRRSAERRVNSRPSINQTSDSNHQITRLWPAQTKRAAEIKQEKQSNTQLTCNRGDKRALLETGENGKSTSDMQLCYDNGYLMGLPRLASGRHKEIQTNSSIFSRAAMRQQSSENIKKKSQNSPAVSAQPKMLNILSAAKQQHNSSSTLSSTSSESRKSVVCQKEYKGPCSGRCRAFYKRTGKHRNLHNPFSGAAACNEPPPPALLKTATIVATTKKRREWDHSRTVSDGESKNSDVECITVEYGSSDATFLDSYAQYQAELQRQQELWRIDNVREAIKVEEQEAERAKAQLRTTLTGESLERAIHYPTRVWNEERKQLNLQRNGATFFGPL